MNIDLHLKEMTIKEKLRIMETLWDDLRQHADQIPPAPWHGELLAKREAAVVHGDAQFEDWEAAKQRIEKDIE